jgi:Prealbumin-like fold domain
VDRDGADQTASKTASGWAFTGLTDAQATNADSGYAGGVKQDVACATIKGSKAPNKDDLKRIYLASKTVGGHVYLNLAWVRIPQNSINASTHVGFEFNQGNTPCGGSSDRLVKRTAGDMLIVYDFEGSSSGVATLTVRRWVTSGACDISQDSAPCWGPATNLTASGFAEAKVNEQAVTDAVAPSQETLGVSEFGEAGIDLTAAGVFQPGVCTAFGQAEGVSRSSGNSGTAAMEDLVGPGHINLTNCGTVTIIKNTDPRGVNQSFSYTSTLTGAQLSCTPDATPASFTLNDGSSTTNTEECTNVPIGSYTVTEGAEPSGFVLESLTCTATGSGSGSQDATNPFQANMTIVAGLDHVTCTYVNQQQLGAIKIAKTSSKTGHNLAGATFSITGPGGYSNSVTTGSDGTVCADGLAFGAYTVTETQAPPGFVIDDSSGHTVTVDNNAKCSDSPYVGETTSFTDTPTSDIQVNFRDGGSGETSGTITCDNTTGAGSDTPASGWDTSLTVTGGHAPTTVHCTIVIAP